jgi:DNA invertase Pin-like site-specific DNA recombinase
MKNYFIFSSHSIKMVKITINFDENSYVTYYNRPLLADENNETQLAIGYCRISTEKQKDNSSIESQIETIKQTCKWNKHKLIAIFVDNGISGKNIEDRPALVELIKLLKDNAEKQHNKLNLHTNFISRLTRSENDMGFFCKFLPEYNINLKAYDCPVNVRDKSQHMILKIMASFAEQQRDQISSNIKNVMRQLSEDGKLITKPPYGFIGEKYQDGDKLRTKLIPNFRQQECINKIIEIWENSGKTVSGGFISRKMNRLLEEDENYYYKDDRREWYATIIDNILYREKMKRREFEEETVPVNMKEEKCKEEIIKMIKSGKLMSLTPNNISRKLDALCLFKHRITPAFARKILQSLPYIYKNKVIQIKIKHEEDIKKTIQENINETDAKIAQILNEANILTLQDKKWTRQVVSNYRNSRQITIKEES